MIALKLSFLEFVNRDSVHKMMEDMINDVIKLYSSSYTHEVWTNDQMSLVGMEDGKITLDLWHSYVLWAWTEGRDPADGLKGLSQEQLRIWRKKYMKALMTQYKTGQ